MTILTSWTQVVSAATDYLSDNDPIMANAIERIGPCTLTPNPNLFETLVDAIISQQISVKAADAIMARLRAAIHAGSDGLIRPEALSLLDQDAMRAVGLSPQKMRYIRDLTDRVTSGQLDLEQLSELDDETVITELVKVKGIGRWTAEMMLISRTQYRRGCTAR
jgi:DNA-3-methyladenine glycosylase II